MDIKNIRKLLSQVSLMYVICNTQASIALACILFAHEGIAISFWVYFISLGLGLVVVGFVRPFRIMNIMVDGHTALRLLKTIHEGDEK